ncbi:MAG TPA: Gfo/Idh/MocA family oxidoreductase [Armatimonadota bacterium]|nr:Gfo/Idh/MocA family oxidoreductase [Armatimonadota bacterium]
MNDRPKVDNRVNVAVVGCGYWGPNLIRDFAQIPDARLYAICDLDADRLAPYAGRYPEARLERDLNLLLQDPALDALVIATAAPSHYRLVSQALAAGKHVYVEKPMTLMVEHAEALAQESEEQDRILMVGHLLEYHPAVDYIKQYIDRGEIGDLLYIYTHRLNLGKIRRDESALWSLAPHDISVVGYLIGETPLQVSAVGQSYLQEGVEDLVFVYLHYSGNRVAHIHVSWLDPHKIRKITVVGSKKMIVFDDMEASEKIRIYDKGFDVATAKFVSEEESIRIRNGDILIPHISSAEPLLQECAQFIRAIQTGVSPRSDARDGLRVVQVLAAAEHSLKNGGHPVTLTPR